MRPIEKYIQELMEKKGFKSYRQLSLSLGMGPSEIFHIMSKRVTPSDALCKKLADLAGDPVEKVLLLAQISKAPDVSRPAWEKIFQAMAFSVVLAVAVAASAFAQAHVVIQKAAYSGYYVKSRKRRRRPLSLCTV